MDDPALLLLIICAAVAGTAAGAFLWLQWQDGRYPEDVKRERGRADIT